MLWRWHRVAPLPPVGLATGQPRTRRKRTKYQVLIDRETASKLAKCGLFTEAESAQLLHAYSKLRRGGRVHITTLFNRLRIQPSDFATQVFTFSTDSDYLTLAEFALGVWLLCAFDLPVLAHALSGTGSLADFVELSRKQNSVLFAAFGVQRAVRHFVFGAWTSKLEERRRTLVAGRTVRAVIADFATHFPDLAPLAPTDADVYKFEPTQAKVLDHAALAYRNGDMTRARQVYDHYHAFETGSPQNSLVIMDLTWTR